MCFSSFLFTREAREKAIEYDSTALEQVLVKYEANSVSVSSIGLPAVVEQQWFQVFEGSKSVVRRAHSLIAFSSTQANSNVGLPDHADVVRAIADGQGDLLRLPLPQELDDLGFVLW